MEKIELNGCDFAFNRLGMGCWALGGPMYLGDDAVGWGPTDDAESLRALREAYDNGIQFFDTADMYGGGHSESLVGQALASVRDSVVIATKFGNRFDAKERQMLPDPGVSPDYIRSACEASLKRLRTDRIDLYQFHVNDYPKEKVDDIVATLESLREQGSIRAFGWSTDFPDRAKAFLKSDGCAAFQYQYNVFDENPDMVALCESSGKVGVNRGPLAMGLLTGKYAEGSAMHREDVRGKRSPGWLNYYKDGKPNEAYLQRLEQVREVLCSEGRTLAQGALAWIWAKSSVNLPIPGIRTVRQALENAAALAKGPLDENQLREVETLMGR